MLDRCWVLRVWVCCWIVCLTCSVSAKTHVEVVEDPGSATAEERQQTIEKLKKVAYRPKLKDPLVQAALVRAEGLFADGKPVREDLDKIVLHIAGSVWNRQDDTSLDQLTAHPQAERWFGAIPDGAKRVKRRVAIDTSIGRWHTTGLYAAPGEVITVEVPERLVGKGYKVRLSGHTDGIGRRKAWLRSPKPVSVARKINAQTIRIGSRFGGAVYLDLGKKPANLGLVRVTIDNVLEAPTFISGRHNNRMWQKKLRQHPAPYAELVGKQVILSVPSDWIRDLDDAKGLVDYWDRVMQLHDELAGTAHLRTSPERVNVDIQISAGLYHAGYPMQGPQRHSRNLVDLKTLKNRGDWGWFHELGHEEQRRPDTAWGWNNPYTFDDSIECTVNLFSTHAMDKLGITERRGWTWTADPKKVTDEAHKAIAKGGYLEVGARGKLAMWMQMRYTFGWKPIHNVLKSYSKDQDKNPERLPAKNDQAKRDEFTLRMSKEIRKNLVPFMRDTWKLPISEEIEKQVKHLPVWKPKAF